MRIDEYKNLIDKIAPSLLELRFTRSGYRFYLPFNNNWGLVDFQRSTKSTKEIVFFTINLGVASGRLLRAFSSIPHGKRPDIWDCQWRIRLGHLIENKDIWWPIENETSINQLSKQLQEHILRFGVPEIHKHISDESLRDLWLSGKSPSLTKFERLRYLIVLVKDLGPQNLLSSIQTELDKDELIS